MNDELKGEELAARGFERRERQVAWWVESQSLVAVVTILSVQLLLEFGMIHARNQLSRSV